jgi:hypothetical protein
VRADNRRVAWKHVAQDLVRGAKRADADEAVAAIAAGTALETAADEDAAAIESAQEA